LKRERDCAEDLLKEAWTVENTRMSGRHTHERDCEQDIDNYQYMRYPLGMDTSNSTKVRPDKSETACCAGEILAETTLAPSQSDALAERLKALADPTRLRMLDLLAQQSAPLCVCEINE
jgi:hypothetical protein